MHVREPVGAVMTAILAGVIVGLILGGCAEALRWLIAREHWQDDAEDAS